MEVSKSGNTQAVQQAQAVKRTQEMRQTEARAAARAEEQKPKDTVARKSPYDPPRETVNSQGQRIGTRLNAVA